VSEETIREVGFAIFKNGTVRRLSPTHYVVKAESASAWNLVELKNGVWTCDCNPTGEPCAHVYSTKLQRYASKEKEQALDELHLRCRYCSSIDIAGCGFRYNSRGIARRYLCRDCQRKFSVPYLQANPASKPNDIAWLLNEVGVLVTRLTSLISDLNNKLDGLPSSASFDIE
jgi:hypothetical protein